MTILPQAVVASVTAAERERSENCAREPIRRPGTIQPHGVLLAVEKTSWIVVQASLNTVEVLGIPAEDLLGTPASDLFGPVPVERFSAVLAGVRGASNPVPVVSGGRRFDAIVHETDGVVVLELEPELPDEFTSVPAVYAAVTRLSAATSRDELWESAARELHELTGFDRVVIYHFHPDGHGQIVAEERADDSMEPYLGLHFPASDIPAQAKALYVTKLSRTIYSTEDLSYPILPAESPVTGEPLDLSRAELRSVSPHHLQFMRNMGQRSTLSFSLIADGELIGMITCAHRTPRRLPHGLRQSLEVFANQIAVQLRAMSQISRLQRAGRSLDLRNRLTEQFTLGRDLAQALLHGTVTILDLIPATAAAVHADGRTVSVGDSSAAARLGEVVKQLLDGGGRLPFASDALASEYPSLAAFVPEVAGLLIVPFGEGRNHLAWFRPEVTETTEWLGDQSEANRASTLSPRSSFSAWRRSVSGRAQPWDDLVGEAIELARDLDTATLRQEDSALARLGLHDELTGLPNRRLLMDRLEHALAGRPRSGEVALLFIDLDSFKAINDSLGHDQGDAVLRQVAERLRSVSRNADTVARLGGDEFVVLCENTGRNAAVRVAERVLSALRPSLAVGGHHLTVTASVGAATARDGDTAADLLRRADAAMYEAKRSGKDRAAD